MTPRFHESRKTARRWMRRSATVVFDAGREPINCIIFDISDGGARLAIAHPSSEIPHSFTLLLFKDGSLQRECEIVWHDNRYVGVKFTSEWHRAVRSRPTAGASD